MVCPAILPDVLGAKRPNTKQLGYELGLANQLAATSNQRLQLGASLDLERQPGNHRQVSEPVEAAPDLL